MSNGVFNFNFLAFLLSELLGGYKFTLGGPVPLCTPPSVKILTCAQVIAYIYITVNFELRSSIHIHVYLTRVLYHICDFSFNFLALVLSEILGGPKFTLGGPTPPRRHLAEEFFYIQRVLHNI